MRTFTKNSKDKEQKFNGSFYIQNEVIKCKNSPLNIKRVNLNKYNRRPTSFIRSRTYKGNEIINNYSEKMKNSYKNCSSANSYKKFRIAVNAIKINGHEKYYIPNRRRHYRQQSSCSRSKSLQHSKFGYN